MSSINFPDSDRSQHYRLIALKPQRFENILLLVWLVVNLVIGALTVHEYGLSIDETNNCRYAKYTLDAYPSLFGTLYEPKYDESFDGHGPAFVAMASILIRLILSIFPNTFEFDLWHFSYFITFQLTGLCLYWLTRRWFSMWTAWGVLVLFITQPMLLGHAFINPKDIPFMFLFTLSIVLGFRLADGMKAEEASISLEATARVLTSKFREADPQHKSRFLTRLVLALAITFILIVFSVQINFLVRQIVIYFYTASPDSWAGWIFNSLASHASNIEEKDYTIKVLRLLRRAELSTLIVAVLFFLADLGLLIGNTTLPIFLNRIWKQRGQAGRFARESAGSLRNALRLSALNVWFAELFQALRDPRVILIGVALGLAAAVRAIGPWAGLIIFLALLAKIRSRAWTITVAYFLVAGIVTYLAWPRLWNAPIRHYLEGLGIISNFSSYVGRVLFNGNLYSIRDLPYSYLPVLLNIQFTEPILVCIYVGLGVLVWRLLHGQQRTDLLLYIGLGFVFPLAGLILLKVPLYHNLRQVLFLLPAMFMFAAFALELVFNKMTKGWARVLLIVVLALPGIYSSIRLYPYEYVYYNSLIGGPAGVQNRYELDYWRISLREAALRLNELAPQGSKILVPRSAGMFDEYSRSDLFIDKATLDPLGTNNQFDYAVQVARWAAWDLYPDAKTVIAIERDGAVIATIKAVKNAPVK